MDTREVGRSGEQRAKKFLEKRGYKVLFENWTCYGGEIDLIVKKETLVFVEVKYVRKNFCNPNELFDYKKQMRLLRAIEKFLQKNPEFIDNWRVDLVCLTKNYGKTWVDHYVNVL